MYILCILQNQNTVKENICSFSHLYTATKLCKRGVMWKRSVACFVNNGSLSCYRLRKSLMTDKYKISPYSIFMINEPKERKIISAKFRDRVFQRSLCDNYLTEKISKSFIYDNCACQKRKGTNFARKRLKIQLQRYARKYGNDFYILQLDLTNFFGSTRHDIAKQIIEDRVENQWVKQRVFDIIDSYNDGPNPEVGMGLGSPVSQLVESAVLDETDHFIKEQLKIEGFVRYNDDFIIIHKDKEYLKYCKSQIKTRLENIGLTLSKKKTLIYPTKRPIKFLGFSFRLKQTGKVIMKLLHNKISKKKRKLRKMVSMVFMGKLNKIDVDNSYKSWISHVKNGNTHNLIYNMNKFYQSLYEN